MIRTFLDAGVLIAAIGGLPVPTERVLGVSNDPERAFLASDFVRREVLPKALYFRQQDEVDFYEAYFATVVEMVIASPALVMQAYTEPNKPVSLAWMRSTLPQPRLVAQRSLLPPNGPRQRSFARREWP